MSRKRKLSSSLTSLTSITTSSTTTSSTTTITKIAKSRTTRSVSTSTKIKSIPTLQISDDVCRWFRLKQSGLYDPHASDPVQVCNETVAVQAQEIPAAAFGIYLRLNEEARKKFKNEKHLVAEFDGRRSSLNRSWAMRHTLHAFHYKKAGLMAAAVGANFQSVEDRCLKLKIEIEKYEAVMKVLATTLQQHGGKMRTKDLLDEVAKQDSVWRDKESRALLRNYHGPLHHLVARGDIILAGKGEFASVKAWVKDVDSDRLPNIPERDECLKILFKEFITHFGPADVKSFQKFAGRGTLIQLREWTKEFVDARVLCEVTVGSPPRSMLCHVDHIELLKQAQQDASIPDKLKALPMRMVPAFDAVTIGYKNKAFWFHDPAVELKMVWYYAVVEPLILYHGKFVGIWRFSKPRQLLRIQFFKSVLRQNIHTERELKEKLQPCIDELKQFFEIDFKVKYVQTMTPANQKQSNDDNSE